ncbi:deoxyribonuclease I [Suicoccus acidiformans]|uniref:Deoxyribonuclease I n=1 Tax=Suicoccus acidiformans TaxID=2036206 RepID=A0A347WNX4_9LACT|nr:deoxyribonuclease I [Suicoccus acidiformans]AXY26781.1 deoxyribonuclease I [Suicoccus acidiformans]
MTVNLKELYGYMLQEMGPQGWWPADSKDEIIIGAFLTQNTNWNNVELSLAQLKKATAFEPEQLLALPRAELEGLIRPSGFFKNKARGLQEFFQWYESFAFEPEAVNAVFPEDQVLRKELLRLHGVGEETADVLRLYVFDQVTFVSDAYARRLFTQLTGVIFPKYKDLQERLTLNSAFNLAEAQEFHGLIDEFGKVYLRGSGKFSESFLAGIRLAEGELLK